MSAPLIEVEDLRIVFRSGTTRVSAVDGVSLAVQAGETFGIIGESGSGKSTLGRALVCLEKPTSGAVRHRGVDPWGLSRAELRRQRRDYQIIFQDSNASLDPRMTILQSVCEPLEPSGMAAAAREAAALEALAQVGVSADMARRYPHELSGGQKQRANIARALTLRPALIVCDESVAALDVSIQAEILNLLAELQRSHGLTYVFISHSLGVIGHISDRVAVMYLGRWMELGPTDAVLDRPLHPYTQALLSAEPMPEPPGAPRRLRIVLAGETPGPDAIPSGCRFRNRCPQAQVLCAAAVPEWREYETGHWVACHFAGTVTGGSSVREAS
jgi:oligopeptide/dipeptide ABC transporter ATP-binding protein